MREPRLPKCPLCKSEFHYKHVDLTMPFRCPMCEEWIRVAHPNWYARKGLLVSIAIAGFACFEFGARGADLVLYTLLLTIPVAFLVVGWRMHFAPPTLAPSSPPSGTDILGISK